MKLTVVTAKQSTLMNLNGLQKRVQMKLKDLSRIAVAKRTKLKNCWEADHNFSWDQKKIADKECRLISKKIRKTIHSFKNPNHINKLLICFLIYGSS